MKKSVFITSLFLGISLFDRAYAAQPQTIQQKIDSNSFRPSEILQAFKEDREFFNKLNQDQRNKVSTMLNPKNEVNKTFWSSLEITKARNAINTASVAAQVAAPAAQTKAASQAETNILTQIRGAKTLQDLNEIKHPEILKAHEANPEFFYKFNEDERHHLSKALNKALKKAPEDIEGLSAAKKALEQVDLDVEAKAHETKKAEVLKYIDELMAKTNKKREKLEQDGIDTAEIHNDNDNRYIPADIFKERFPGQNLNLANPEHKKFRDHFVHQGRLQSLDNEKKILEYQREEAEKGYIKVRDYNTKNAEQLVRQEHGGL